MPAFASRTRHCSTQSVQAREPPPAKSRNVHSPASTTCSGSRPTGRRTPSPSSLRPPCFRGRLRQDVRDLRYSYGFLSGSQLSLHPRLLPPRSEIRFASCPIPECSIARVGCPTVHEETNRANPYHTDFVPPVGRRAVVQCEQREPDSARVDRHVHVIDVTPGALSSLRNCTV